MTTGVKLFGVVLDNASPADSTLLAHGEAASAPGDTSSAFTAFLDSQAAQTHRRQPLLSQSAPHFSVESSATITKRCSSAEAGPAAAADIQKRLRITGGSGEELALLPWPAGGSTRAGFAGAHPCISSWAPPGAHAALWSQPGEGMPPLAACLAACAEREHSISGGSARSSLQSNSSAFSIATPSAATSNFLSAPSWPQGSTSSFNTSAQAQVQAYAAWLQLQLAAAPPAASGSAAAASQLLQPLAQHAALGVPVVTPPPPRLAAHLTPLRPSAESAFEPVTSSAAFQPRPTPPMFAPVTRPSIPPASAAAADNAAVMPSPSKPLAQRPVRRQSIKRGSLDSQGTSRSSDPDLAFTLASLGPIDGKTPAERRRETVAIQATLPPDMKICSSCRQIKPRSTYHACRAKRDGLQDRCRECRAALDKARTALARPSNLNASRAGSLAQQRGSRDAELFVRGQRSCRRQSEPAVESAASAAALLSLSTVRRDSAPSAAGRPSSSSSALEMWTARRQYIDDDPQATAVAGSQPQYPVAARPRLGSSASWNAHKGVQVTSGEYPFQLLDNAPVGIKSENCWAGTPEPNLRQPMPDQPFAPVPRMPLPAAHPALQQSQHPQQGFGPVPSSHVSAAVTGTSAFHSPSTGRPYQAAGSPFKAVGSHSKPPVSPVKQEASPMKPLGSCSAAATLFLAGSTEQPVVVPRKKRSVGPGNKAAAAARGLATRAGGIATGETGETSTAVSSGRLLLAMLTCTAAIAAARWPLGFRGVACALGLPSAAGLALTSAAATAAAVVERPIPVPAAQPPSSVNN